MKPGPAPFEFTINISDSFAASIAVRCLTFSLCRTNSAHFALVVTVSVDSFRPPSDVVLDTTISMGNLKIVPAEGLSGEPTAVLKSEIA